MILENLKNFEWYNEPANVVFGSHELEIVAAEGTDFWQSAHHNFFKDNGHFFFTKQTSDFSCVIKWRFDNAARFSQCGLMLRADGRNWFKISVMSADENNPEVGSCVTKDGISDWAGVSSYTSSFDLAETCVFVKQLLGTLLCDHMLLWYPFSLSYGVSLPSSLTILLSLVLGSSPHLPVSVCGTGTLYNFFKLFSPV